MTDTANDAATVGRRRVVVLVPLVVFLALAALFLFRLYGGGERIAVAAEEAPRIVRLVLVIDSDQAEAAILGELHEQRRLVVTRHAP